MSPLIEEAQRADDILDAFGTFRRACPNEAQGISAGIQGIASLSWALRDMAGLLNSNTTHLDWIESDLELVHNKISLTLDEIWLLLGQTGNGDPGTPITDVDYQRTWSNIEWYCRNYGRLPLHTRTDVLSRFLMALSKNLRGDRPSKQEYDNLKHEVDSLQISPTPLLQKQRDQQQVLLNPWPLRVDTDARAPARPNTSKQQQPRKPKSYERPPPRQEPLSPWSYGNIPPFFQQPSPMMHSPPQSPATTFSAASHTSSLDRELAEHWTKDLMVEATSTRLPSTYEPSQYHDTIEHSSECSIPDNRYDVAMALEFPPGLVASFHYNVESGRAKMLINQPSRHGNILRCMPLNGLKLHRAGPVLRFCHLSRDKRSLVPWVSLQFLTYERLVLFACTFVAMRMFSGGRPDHPIWTDEPTGEVLEFKGRIYDSRYRYDLYIYRDRLSKAIRLQACKYEGQYEGTPVWTAFVTYPIAAPSWVEKVERKQVFLNDLRLHVFRSKYALDRSPSGAHILHFERSDDTEQFVKTVARLQERITRPR